GAPGGDAHAQPDDHRQERIVRPGGHVLALFQPDATASSIVTTPTGMDNRLGECPTPCTRTQSHPRRHTTELLFDLQTLSHLALEARMRRRRAYTRARPAAAPRSAASNAATACARTHAHGVADDPFALAEAKMGARLLWVG